MPSQIVNRGNGISGGGVVIKLHRMEAFLMSSYMLPKVACFISFSVVLVTFVGFFLPWSIVNRNNGLE